jgi:Lar family restriction alleviation protein
MSEQTELKPCPFCGGKAESWTYMDRGFLRAAARCRDCTARVWDATETEAVAAWNRRPQGAVTPAAKIDNLTRDEAEGRARALYLKSGWEAGDKLGAHSVLQLMSALALDVAVNPLVSCDYPGCGCDADAVCNVARPVAHSSRSAVDDR